ncbi:hypothetical protein Btru_014848 [Bulinus truncatus]|nr:hypothetical protein Btru_014848 [Bulinus truncatus]
MASLSTGINLTVKMVHRIIFCLTAGVLLGRVECHISQYQELLYGVTANLTCADDRFSPEEISDGPFRYLWILPNTEVLNETKVAANQHYSIQSNGSVLLIHNIDKPDFGVYHCLVQKYPDNIYAVVKLGININGPFFGNLWELYAYNLKIGIISGIIVLIVMGMFCYNYDQFQSKHDRPELKEMHKDRSATSPQQDNLHPREMFYKNPVFVDDDHCCKVQDNQKQAESNNIHVSAEISDAKTNL